MIYLDHNATTPVVPEARAAVLAALETAWANPSSSHAAGRLAHKLLEAARMDVAQALGRDVGDIVFQSGATEAINHAIEAAGPGSVWISAVEHPAVTAALAVRPDRDVTTIPVNRAGEIDVDALLADIDAADHKPTLVAVMAANNVTGVCQPVRHLATELATREIPFLVDAVQYAGKASLDGLNPDYLVCSAHKLGGPKGAGALVLRRGLTLAPRIVGGGQERGMRCGTESIPAIAGFGAAMRRVRLRRDEDAAAIGQLRDQLEQRLLAIDGLQVVGQGAAERLTNTLSLILPEGAEAEPVMTRLDRAGVAVSAGSACHAGSLKPSAVLIAMGYTPAECFRALRISLGYGNTSADVDKAASLVTRFAQEVAHW